jgi:hypothetical protein
MAKFNTTDLANGHVFYPPHLETNKETNLFGIEFMIRVVCQTVALAPKDPNDGAQSHYAATDREH